MTDTRINEMLDRVVTLLRQSQNLLFITGAGMSADSGLPTYRGVGGLYNVDETEEGMPIEELLSGYTMQTRPELTWKYLAQIAKACQDAKFNRGHQVIAEMEEYFDRVLVLTQNIDGFHRHAGSRNVIDIHGDLHELLCTDCGARDVVVDIGAIPVPPRCSRCQAIMRPNVVLFGEMLSLDKIQRLQDELAEGFDLVFSIGTTSVFPYISEPVLIAARSGCPTVEINPGESEISGIVDIKLSLRAAEALDQLWTRFQTAA